MTQEGRFIKKNFFNESGNSHTGKMTYLCRKSHQNTRKHKIMENECVYLDLGRHSRPFDYMDITTPCIFFTEFGHTFLEDQKMRAKNKYYFEQHHNGSI
jgi:hypothetical protein